MRRRCMTTAHKLFNRCRDEWKLPGHLADLLGWAADLHELGLAVSHSSYHKHGGYLLEYADLPGFSTEEQRWLSVLVRTHRQKISTKLFSLLDSGRLPECAVFERIVAAGGVAAPFA